jgi:NAD(P) transhydrogenase subunit beta
MTATLATVSYIGATILFILSLGGLSNPETSRRGNLYGIIGMTIAVLATVFGPRVTPAGYAWIVTAMVIGGSIGLYASRIVRMTQMPELVALMHSLVGLAAMLVGYANYIDPAASAGFAGAEKTIHEVEIYLGILIGAVTSFLNPRYALRRVWKQKLAPNLSSLKLGVLSRAFPFRSNHPRTETP